MAAGDVFGVEVRLNLPNKVYLCNLFWSLNSQKSNCRYASFDDCFVYIR